METTRLTSKGQVVIPKPIRDALHIRPGTQFTVTAEGNRIILETLTRKTHKFSEWPGFRRNTVTLTTEELCRPVDLNEV